jgi:two-component system nitrate/nitrite response regulator NarL
MSSLIRILLCDDHPVFRRGLRALLLAEGDLVVVGEAQDGAEAVGKVRELQPDVLLLDMAMPNRTGLDVLQDLAGEPQRPRTLVLTAAIERWQVVEALRLGASGVILKDTASDLLVKAIRRVAEGELWVGRGDVAEIVTALRQPQAAEGAGRFGLSKRELEVVKTVADGCTNKEIAKRLGISEDTVKHHMTSIFDKLGVSTRLELAIFASNWKLVDGA